MSRSSFHSMVAPAAFAIVIAAASQAPAGPTVPHKEHAEGHLTYVEFPTPEEPVGRMEFEAAGKGTRLGKYTQVGGHDFFPDGTLEGEFETTASDGSTISGTYSGTYEDIGGGLVRFDVEAVWLVGTARLEGVTGSARVIAVLDLATGEFFYDTNGTWNLP